MLPRNAFARACRRLSENRIIRKVDEDEAEAADSYELPGADLSGEELSVRVLPRQADEFTCASCFLVKHRSQIDHVEGTLIICKECAAA